MVPNEKSFPRGGTIHSEAKTADISSNIVFGASQKKVKKAPKVKDNFLNDASEEQNEQLEAFSAESLNLDTLQEDMLVMGVVKETSATALQIALPGRLFARTLVADISEAYTRVAKAAMSGDTSEYHDLTELFQVGRIVYGKAIKTDKLGSSRISLLLSLKPADVHGSLHHKSIKKGFIFSGAVSEIQEHGYVIESGVQGLQAFVPCEEPAQTLHVGQLTFLKVNKVQHDTHQSTCTCVQVQQDQMRIKSQNETNLDYILPGSIVKFKVAKHLKDGLKGSIMNESFSAYINEHHLANALDTLDTYELNEDYNARVLYVMPLTKLVYLTLNLDIKAGDEVGKDQDEEEEEVGEPLKVGSVVEKAKVLRLGSGGVVLLLNKKLKGLISYGSIRANFKGNYDKDEVLSKYGRKTKHKVRILGYDVIESLYYCSDDPNVINEKIYSLEDINAGDLVTAKIFKKDAKIKGWSVRIGKVNGILEQFYLAPNLRYDVGQSVRCRVLEVNVERKVCYLSNRSEYLGKGVKLLTDYSDGHVGNVYTGTVVRCEDNYVLVKFGNGVKGVLHRQNLKEKSSFFEGQTTKFRILSRNKDQITLTMPEDKFQLGEICPVEVTNVLDAGLEIKITFAADDEDEDEDGNPSVEEYVGLIPLRLLSDHLELLHAQMRVHPAGSHTEAACIMQNIFSLRDVAYFSGQLTKDWQSVKVGDIIRSYVKHATDQVVDLMVSVRDYNKPVKVHVKMLRLNAVKNAPVELVPEQLLLVKVLSKEAETKTLTVSAKLTDVWSGDLSDTAKMVESYLDEVAKIKAALQNTSAPISKYSVGDKIDVVFKGIDATSNDWVYTVEGGSKVSALLLSSLVGTAKAPEAGSKNQAIILWIDYSSDVLLISNKKLDIAHISPSGKLSANLIGKAGMKAKVLLKLESVVVCSLKKGTNPLVICPIRLHPNDVENSGSAELRQGDFCNVAFIHDKLPIAVPETVWRLWRGIKRTAGSEESLVKPKKAKLEKLTEQKKTIIEEKKVKSEVKPLKRKAEEAEILTNGKKKTTPVTNGIVKEKPKQNGKLFFEDKTPAKNTKSETPKSNGTEAKTRLPGVSSFWDNDLNQSKEASSDEDEEQDALATQQNAAKKKRLSSKEKAKAEVKEEQRLREIEERNADPKARLETIDQYERLVIAQPNNSISWLKYMAFLLSNTEIEKARDLTRRAISTISFREAQELRNMWSALLNLELVYGNNFDEVLKEALNCNDPLEIYINVVDILKRNKKKERLSSVLTTILNKFKAELRVWPLAAEAYFWLGKSDQVHNLLQRALRGLPNQGHIPCIVSFAKLYAKNDNNDMAQTLLDDVVTSYPKRIDIWSVYVDMLIKAGLIDSARNVLERAALQKLKPNKMQVIYKKYLQLEENHGTEATVAKVKQQAEQWVKNYAKATK
ncbi:LOW QUALITY PROTEIN: protein RRP5 homolog [Drosophila eugracilis]|uniref:LOW QUALITY PROTEIN: protein RRP5 homolog n=1 Tax=Drosophila eugracilis TaxID=29029 RepID=UPI001BD9F618|nr:LOW QUALITY PROTEIN: protein RRP5 homolog [Drosophila eugracilis]